MNENFVKLIESECWLEASNLARKHLLNYNNPSYYCSLVVSLEKVGKLIEALKGLELLVSVYPQKTSFLLEYARLLILNGFCDKAIEIWQKILEFSPDSATVIFNLAKAYGEIGEQKKAIIYYEKLLRLYPDHKSALYNLANLRQRNGEFNLALSLYKELLGLDHLNLDAWINIGKTYKSLCFYDKAEFCYRRVIELDFDNVTAHWNLSHLLLARERWREGWCEYEWRLKRAATFSPQGINDIPVWDGEDLSGRSILLWVEQGAGDAIQFIRFVSFLPGSPKKVMIYCPPGLVRLLATANGVDSVTSYSDSPPATDYQLSLLSIPQRLFFSTANELRPCEPYLHPASGTEKNVAKTNELEAIAGFAGGEFRVGVVWAGNPLHANDKRRSLSLSDFNVLFELQNISFFSLQISAQKSCSSENGSRKHESLLPQGVIDLAPVLHDFADSAYWLSKLDLLITVDTAMAHLAGSLGCPAWVLLPHEADWRWSIKRPESLWYSSLRLFRQSQAGDWSSVLAAVKHELELH